MCVLLNFLVAAAAMRVCQRMRWNRWQPLSQLSLANELIRTKMDKRAATTAGSCSGNRVPDVALPFVATKGAGKRSLTDRDSPERRLQ